LFFTHDLDIELPFREIAAGDRVMEVAAMKVAVHSGNLARFFIAQALDALFGLEVEFDPNALAFLIDQREGVLAEHIHIAEGGGNAPIRHRDGDLMEALREASSRNPKCYWHHGAQSPDRV
jgi:hypothetical protein